MQYLDHRPIYGTATGSKIWIQPSKSAVRGFRRRRESTNPSSDPLRETWYDSNSEPLNVTGIRKPSRRSVNTRRLADLPAVIRPSSEMAPQGPKSMARNIAPPPLQLRLYESIEPKQQELTSACISVLPATPAMC